MKLPKLSRLLIIVFTLFCIFVLLLALRGLPGNPAAEQLNTKYWEDNGPFELSPERGRFTLLFSIIEDKSFYFSNSIAEFASPDVGIHNGHFVSLFAPLLSFLAVPGYIIGKYFGASQVGTFAIVSVFALLNIILLRLIAIRLGASSIAATIASLIFLFATPAFAYAVDLYQHHISTFLVLLSIYVLLKSNRTWSLLVVFFLFALAIPLDYPNLVFMFPILLFSLGKIILFKDISNRLQIRVFMFKAFTPIIMIIPLLFFLWFNNASYGNPFQLSGTVQPAKFNASTLDSKVSLENVISNKEDPAKRSALAFFDSRGLLNGFYIQFISPDRGILYFTPVILLGILGAFLAFKKRVGMVPLLVAIIGANILLYSMWGDPWGGWAFGSRYLIPSYAILAIFISLLLTYWRRNIIFLAIFLILFGYSAAVNTLGAITTSAMPPQVEVLNLEKISGMVQRYTYQRNWEFLLAGNSKSFVYQTFGRYYITSVQYFEILAGLIILAGFSLTAFLAISGKENR